ncbi:MAG: CHASE2 domain-containing protein, partial [Candidatus Aminicenantales bacterium]
MKTRVVCGLVIAAAVFVVVFVLETLDVLEPWEWKTWDLRLRLFSHPERASPDIVLVLIDQQSLDVYEKEMALSWPWPREMHAYLIAFLKRGGARAVFLDFLFTEPSVYGPEDDQALARAMAEAGNVFLPLSLTQKASSSRDSLADLPGRFFLPEKEVSKTPSYPAESVHRPV